MAERVRSSMFPDVARYAHLAQDGTIHYFESDGKKSSEGSLPPGVNPREVEAQGFVFLDSQAYERTRASLDPIARAEERDADELSTAWDNLVGRSAPREQEQKQEPQSMDGQNGAMDPEVMALFQQYMDEGRLPELFQPFQQEQNVLGQEMQLAEGLRQSGPQRSTPMGALFGGLANAAGNIGAAALQKKGLEGQTALGKRMQGDASGRTGAILRAAMKRRGMNPDTGLMDTAVDDATLSQLFSGG